MNRKVLSFLLVVMVAIFAGYSVFSAMGEFAADYSMTDAKGKIATGKTFVKGDKIRQETTIEGQTNITILRLDKKITWTLMPENNQYMEMELPFDTAHPENYPEFKYETKVLGNETINGFDCQVILYTYENKKYGTMVQWVSSKLNFAVKYQCKNSKGKVTSTMEYTNIKTGKVDDALFEIPAGYSKFSIPIKIKIPGLK